LLLRCYYAVRVTKSTGNKPGEKAVFTNLLRIDYAYSPLKHWNAGPGKKVGVVGIGGLGHMAVKLAKAMGAEVIVFTTSASKFDDAKRLGANDVVLSTVKGRCEISIRDRHGVIKKINEI